MRERCSRQQDAKTDTAKKSPSLNTYISFQGTGIFIIRNIFLIAIAIATIGGASTDKACACNLRLPTFEVTGFPISPHQVAVLRAAVLFAQDRSDAARARYAADLEA